MQKPAAAQQNNAQAATKNVANNAGADSLRARLVRATQWSAVGALALVAGCATRSPSPPPSAPAPAPAPSAAPAPAASGMAAVRSMVEYRRRAAQMIMAANTTNTFAGGIPDPLYGIVVVTIAFNADGSVKSTNFMRRSSVGPEANNLAIEAVRRVRSFGPISNLPGPWEYNETFFYNDALKFQLRTIVEKL
jgi:hypothetical protein